jgi:hypothetical protein
MKECNFDPEFELLLHCSRPKLEHHNREQIHALLNKELKWALILQLARSYRVDPLLFQSLKSAYPEKVPQPILQQLQDDYLRNLQASLFQTGELFGILDLLTQAQIPAVPYKGVVLSHSLYQNIHLRRAGDIDLLVHRKDVRRTYRLLTENGYRQTWPEAILTHAQEEEHLQAKYNYGFTRADDRILLELHWGVTPKYFSFPPEADWLWGQLETVTLGGRVLPTFKPEAYLLILAVHGANHCWIRLSWICDIYALLQSHPNLDWDWISRQARSTGSERMLHLALCLAHDLLGAELSPALLSKIDKDPVVQALAGQVKTLLAGKRAYLSEAFEIPRFHIKVRERLSDRVRYLANMAVPTAGDWTNQPLPRHVNWLYYLYRPIRLVLQHGVIPVLKKDE